MIRIYIWMSWLHDFTSFILCMCVTNNLDWIITKINFNWKGVLEIVVGGGNFFYYFPLTSFVFPTNTFELQIATGDSNDDDDDDDNILNKIGQFFCLLFVWYNFFFWNVRISFPAPHTHTKTHIYRSLTYDTNKLWHRWKFKISNQNDKMFDSKKKIRIKNRISISICFGNYSIYQIESKFCSHHDFSTESKVCVCVCLCVQLIWSKKKNK